jgi:hypothetical protein
MNVVVKSLARFAIHGLSKGEYRKLLKLVDGDPNFRDNLNECLVNALFVVRPQEARKAYSDFDRVGAATIRRLQKQYGLHR